MLNPRAPCAGKGPRGNSGSGSYLYLEFVWGGGVDTS